MLYVCDATEELPYLIVSGKIGIPLARMCRARDVYNLWGPVDKAALYRDLAAWVPVEETEYLGVLELVAPELFKEDGVLTGVTVEPLTHTVIPDVEIVDVDNVVDVSGLVAPGLTIVDDDGGLLKREAAAFMRLVCAEKLIVTSERTEMIIGPDQAVADLALVNFLLNFQ